MTLAVPSVQGRWLPQIEELWPYQRVFLASGNWQWEGLFGLSISIALPVHAFKGLPWLGSFSVALPIRPLKGPTDWSPTLLFRMSAAWRASLFIVQLPVLACEEREAIVMATPPTYDSEVSLCLYDCLFFLHRHFPPQSPPSHPLRPSSCSQLHTSPWDGSTIPTLQLPIAVPSRGLTSLFGVHMSMARSVGFSFHLACHRSAASLSASNVSLLFQAIAPMGWTNSCFSYPTHQRQAQSY